MAESGSSNSDELLVSLEESIVVQSEDFFIDYDDNYVRRFSGPVFLVSGTAGEETKIGEVMSNDLPAIDFVTLLPEYRNRNYGARMVVAVDRAVGYHCGSLVVRPEGIETADADPDVIAEREPEYVPPYQLVPTKNPAIRVVTFP